MGTLTQIKKYVVQEHLGNGGFGDVYRATRPVIGGDVAIKVIKPELASKPDFIRRFENEAQMIARLDHLHIVPLFDYWRDPDGAYLVMRWLKGGNLKELLEDGPVRISRSQAILDQIATALAHAHRQGVIHRDIKPANVLFDEDGNAYLADFGIAKDLSKFNQQTHTGDFVGTVGYTAPEQIRGEVVSPQTDVYSLGVVLYEMLVGEHPFPNLNQVEQIYKSLNEPLPLLQHLDDTILDDVNQIIQMATAKDPQKRYADVLEMATAFREAVTGVADTAPQEIVEALTWREQEILRLIIDGKSNREIATALFITLNTVKWYISQMYKKLGVRNRVQAIVVARKLNLIVDNVAPDDADNSRQLATYYALTDLANPYKGLQAFQLADEKDFYGREKITQKLLRRLDEDVPYQRFLAILGPSGSGKSSLLHAGLVPEILRQEDGWFIADMLPGTHPVDELEIALIKLAADQGNNLGEQLQRDERGLLRASQLILPDDGKTELLLVIDQFEEIFTLVEDEQRRSYFLDLLVAAVTDPRSRIRIVITMRADFFDRPLQYADFGQMLRARMETILPLSAEELEAAITKPAGKQGVTFEAGLVSSIVSDINYQPGALPLLQYALTELFDRREGRVITHQTYEDIGGTIGALAKRADDILSEFSGDGRTLTHQMFMRLVTLGEGTEDTRRRVNRSELLDLTPDVDLMEEIIDTFADYRLLALDRDPATREPTVEVAHEAILREWERLRGWLNDSRDDIKTQRQVSTLSAEWEAHERSMDYLVRGARLDQLKLWSTDTSLTLTPSEQAFLDASLAERERRQAKEKAQAEREASLQLRARRILQGLVAVFLVAALISGVIAVWANTQRNRAVEAEDEAKNQAQLANQAKEEAERQASIGLAALAEKELEGTNPERGVLLALEALEHYPYTPQAQAALVRTVDAYRSVEILGISEDDNYGENFYAARWSPDGTRVVAAGPNSPNTIVMWDVPSGDVQLSLHKHEDLCEGFQIVWHVAWSPSSDRVATFAAGPQDTPCGIVIWDSTTGATILEITELESVVHSIDWSPDGNVLLTSNDDGTATLWDAETGDRMLPLIGHTARVRDAQFSPDGTQIVTASSDGTVRFWDTETGEEHEEQVLAGHVGSVDDLAWSPDGTHLITAGVDGLPRVWDLKTGEVLFVLKGHQGTVVDVDWSPNGRMLATISTHDATAKIWDATKGRPLFEIRGVYQPFGIFSPDSSRLLTSHTFSQLHMWDVMQTTPLLIQHRNGQEYAAWSPDGSLIATLGNDFTSVVWNPETGEQVAVLEDVNARYGDWSPDSTRIVIPDMGTTNVFYIWDITGTEELITFAPPEGLMPVFANWSPDSKFIAGGLWQQQGEKPIYIWDAETLEVTSILQPDDTCMQAWPEWSPDGTKIVSACLDFAEPGRNTPARIRDVATGEELMVLKSEHGWTGHAMWSPDGKRLLVTYKQGVAKIWDVETGDVLQTFASHSVNVAGADWSPDGIHVVTGDSNGNVKVWNSETGEEVTSYTIQADVQNTKWSPNGTHIIITGSGTAEPVIKRVWLSVEELIDYAYACCVTRELTPEERVQFGLSPQE